MTPLEQVPPRVRLVAYWTAWVLGSISQGITVVWAAIAAASPEVRMPLWLVITSAIIGLAQSQLHLIAGSNVPPYRDVDGLDD